MRTKGRPPGPGKLPAQLIGGLLILLILWMLARGFGGDGAPRVDNTQVDRRGAATGAPTARRDITDWPALPLAEMRDRPVAAGSRISGIGTVSELVSANAFWIEAEGARLLVVVAAPDSTAGDLQNGQMVRLEDAQITTAEDTLVILEDTVSSLVGNRPFIYVRDGKLDPI